MLTDPYVTKRTPNSFKGRPQELKELGRELDLGGKEEEGGGALKLFPNFASNTTSKQRGPQMLLSERHPTWLSDMKW